MFESIRFGPKQTFKLRTERPKVQPNRVKEQNKEHQNSENINVSEEKKDTRKGMPGTTDKTKEEFTEFAKTRRNA